MSRVASAGATTLAAESLLLTIFEVHLVSLAICAGVPLQKPGTLASFQTW